MDAAEREQLLLHAADVLGAETFNRLVTSAPAARAKGRLRYWQEELLGRLPAAGGAPVQTLEEFLAVFEGAELRTLPERPPRVVTRDEFLGDPVGVYLDPDAAGIPAE